MRDGKALLALAALLLGACATAPSSEVAQVAPTGALRVAIGVGPSPSAFWATRDPYDGKPRGVTVELGKAAAAKLGVPLQLVEYPNSGEITAAASKGAWDISFMPQDPARNDARRCSTSPSGRRVRACSTGRSSRRARARRRVAAL
jgi:polar amino acid transport system substrate-binding protein